MKKKTRVVNFYGGPGTCKSTMCAHVFAMLKWENINCEMSLEYAKDKTWEESFKVLHDQLYVFGKQQHRLFRLRNQVDIILTDSPLLLSLIYDSEKSNELKKLVLKEYYKYDNIDIFLNRRKPYNLKGRNQTLEQSKQLDEDIREMLYDNKIGNVYVFDGAPLSVQPIVDIIKNELKGLPLY